MRQHQIQPGAASVDNNGTPGWEVDEVAHHGIVATIAVVFDDDELGARREFSSGQICRVNIQSSTKCH